MLGAIIGDIVGSRFEGRRRNVHTKNFTFFHDHCHLTDDSVMTLAIAEAILQCQGDYSKLAAKATACMQDWGRRYPKSGYGPSFIDWIFSDHPEPYNSYGNGSAMRVSPCAYAAQSLEEALQLCDTVTQITHNHPEGMKGARAVTAAIFLARQGKSQAEIRAYVKDQYYTFDPYIDSNNYQGGCSCQVTVPQALQAYFDATSFEDAIRGAVALGGDSDTIACMAGGIAEATFGIPRAMREQALTKFTADELQVLLAFEAKFGAAKETTAVPFTNAPQGNAKNEPLPSYLAPEAPHLSEYMRKAIYNGIACIQESFLKIIPGDPTTQQEFSWIRGLPFNPTFDDMIFRYKNQIFSIYVDLVPAGQKWHTFQNPDHLRQLRVCQEHGLIPCCYPLHKRSLQPLTDGWNLFHTGTGEPIDPQVLATDIPLPMDAWEQSSYAIDVLIRNLTEKGCEILSWSDMPGIVPQIWFRAKDGEARWLVVQPYKKGTEPPAAPKLTLPPNLQMFPGYYVNVELSNENDEPGPINRDSFINYKYKMHEFPQTGAKPTIIN